MAELPTIESIQYTPLQTTLREPQLRLPNTIDMNSPYALFSLFFKEEIIEKISQSTNVYAKRKRDSEMENEEIKPRSWQKTNAAEIKVFLGILVYMGVHRSPRIDHYWRENPWDGPLHLPRLYMTQKRFEQIK